MSLKGPYLAKDEDQFSDFINQYKGMNYFEDTFKKVNICELVKGAFTSLITLYRIFIKHLFQGHNLVL